MWEMNVITLRSVVCVEPWKNLWKKKTATIGKRIKIVLALNTGGLLTARKNLNVRRGKKKPSTRRSSKFRASPDCERRGRRRIQKIDVPVDNRIDRAQPYCLIASVRRVAVVYYIHCISAYTHIYIYIEYTRTHLYDNIIYMYIHGIHRVVVDRVRVLVSDVTAVAGRARPV